MVLNTVLFLLLFVNFMLSDYFYKLCRDRETTSKLIQINTSNCQLQPNESNWYYLLHWGNTYCIAWENQVSKQQEDNKALTQTTTLEYPPLNGDTQNGQTLDTRWIIYIKDKDTQGLRRVHMWQGKGTQDNREHNKY